VSISTASFTSLGNHHPLGYAQTMNSLEPITVVETQAFLRDSKSLLDEDEREALVWFLACHPDAGDVLKGTGGVRKIRWARKNEGKSGGYRVIYLYHAKTFPVFALNVFAKNEKANISTAERNDLLKLTGLLIENYKNTGGRV
jgi:hypothetical protein